MKKLVVSFILVFVSICVTAQNIGDDIKAKSIAKMRADAEPISDIIATINKGDVVKILSIESGYYYVDYKGTKGYVNEAYFKFEDFGLLPSKSTYVTKSKSTTENKPIKEMKKIWKNNTVYMYYVHNGISVTLTVGLDDIYGKCYTLNFAIENFTGKDFMFYPDEIHLRVINGDKRKVGEIIPYYDFMKKVNRKQTWNQFFVNLNESLAASQAGHSYSSTSSSTVSGSYTQSAAIGATAGFYGNNYGAAVGVAYGESSTISASNTVSNTHNYNGTEAYYAQENAQRKANEYADKQYQIRQIIDDGYLKTTTIKNEERLVGFVAAKYKKADELEIEITVNREKYTFNIY